MSGDILKVLMFGWEFPPYFAGGVGTVCEQLTKALVKQGADITFVMPKGPNTVVSDHVKLLVADNLVPNSKIKIKPINSLMSAYQSISEYESSFLKYLTENKGSSGTLYGSDLLQEIYRFAAKCELLAEMEDFDVIHAHDWVTFPAAIAAKKISGKPMIVHMHITEFDKTGGMHADPRVYAIEKMGMEQADVVIANSHMIKNRAINQYFIDPKKIQVVHNAAEFHSRADNHEPSLIKSADEKLVLFLGRVTLQKGPDYFVDVAKMINDKMPNTKFVLAGTGDMLPQVINKAGNLGILNKFLFPGFVSREEGDRLYRMADLFIMPSVSEPFGIVPLEAMYNDTPVIISKQSGISEVLRNCLKCDFWDVQDMAAKALAALSYPSLSNHMKTQGKDELTLMSWDNPAKQCMNIYNDLGGKWSA